MHKKFILFFLLVIICFSIYGQTDFTKSMEDPNAKFYQIQARGDTFYKYHPDTVEGRSGMVYERWSSWWKTRTSGGDGTSYKQDFWQWNQVINIWTQKTNFGGTGRSTAVGFSIGTNGYIGTASGNTFVDDFWEYCDTCLVGINELNSSTQISAFPNPSREKVTIQSTCLLKHIEIYNLQGEKIYEEKNDSKVQIEINIKQFNAGTYIYHVTSSESNKDIKGKFIVIK